MKSKSAAKRVTKKLTNRHTFRFKIENGQIIKARAVVRSATKPVSLVLTEQHFRDAIAGGGQGNAQKCAMAVCSRSHGDAFPFKFYYVDWTYARAHFVTKLNSQTGLPSECVVYTHHDDVAPLFDTKAGMKKLLKEIQEKGGSKTINLYPPKPRSQAVGRPRGQNTGERTRVAKKGQMQRLNNAMLGISPDFSAAAQA